MADKTESVLRFEGVAYQAPDESFASFAGASLSLGRGALAVVHVDHDSEHVPIADLATGLLAPTVGRVYIEDQDWLTMNAFVQAAARGRIGCVLERPSWVSSLSVLQNITLRERHHTHRTDAAIEAEAHSLCKEIGLASIPNSRPDRMRSRELRMLEWVRAFMGRPALVVLISPERDALSGSFPACLKLVARARSEGTAVLWVSDRVELSRELPIAGVDHFQIKDERWIPLDAEVSNES